ncbi:MAG TPA: hypothetical protein DCW29_00940 [Janthinobacterium sp.]|nr:hypothetical protein [Janthinobacterium sp.]
MSKKQSFSILSAAMFALPAAYATDAMALEHRPGAELPAARSVAQEYGGGSLAAANFTGAPALTEGARQGFRVRRANFETVKARDERAAREGARPSEPRGYALLLIGLGILGFSARDQRNEIFNKNI